MQSDIEIHGITLHSLKLRDAFAIYESISKEGVNQIFTLEGIQKYLRQIADIPESIDIGELTFLQLEEIWAKFLQLNPPIVIMVQYINNIMALSPDKLEGLLK